MKNQWLWILDAWQTLDHPRDTSLRLIQEAIIQKIECWICTPQDLSLNHRQLEIQSQKVIRISKYRKTETIQLSTQKLKKLQDFSKIFYRVDPPVDLKYLQPLQLLSTASEILKGQKIKSPEFINPLAVLSNENEKITGLQTPFAPQTLISSNQSQILKFIHNHNGKAVLKPLHLAQSKDIHKIEISKNRKPTLAQLALIDRLTEDSKRPIVAQEFLPAIHQGETRLWFCDSTLIACARKVPIPGSFKIDMDQGARLEPHRLTDAEKITAKAVSKLLKKQRIRMAAVDLIDAKITDYNFTSPGLLVGLEKILNKNLAQMIIRKLKT